MEKMQGQRSFDLTNKQKPYFVLSFVIVTLLTLSSWAIAWFCPELIYQGGTHYTININYIEYLSSNFFRYGGGYKAAAIIQLILQAIIMISFIISSWGICRYIVCYITYPKWINWYLQEHTKIINSCDTSTFNDSVVMVVPVCNDISPLTILQTRKQTYKNMDVYICDDSSKDEEIKKNKEFCSKYGVKYVARDPAHKKLHPTKMGNMHWFLNNVGYKYDFILENDSSSIITPHFVENALCYYHSPLIDRSKIGGIVTTGQFYYTKNLLSWLNSVNSQWNEASGFGTAIRAFGGPVYLQGWGTFYETKLLKTIPIEAVECPVCDMAKGAYLTKAGYQNYWEPFDFSGKIGQQSMRSWTAQRLKWNGGDVFVFKHLVNKKYPSINKSLFVKCVSYATILIPFAFILGLISVIIGVSLNIAFFNLTAALIIGAIFATLILCAVIGFIVNKVPLKPILCALILLCCEAAIVYKRAWQIGIKGLIFNKWSSRFVTSKQIRKTTFLEKMSSCKWDLIWVILVLMSSLLITFLTNRDIYLIWLSLVPFAIIPSVFLIFTTFISEIPISKGWDGTTDSYDIAKTDFRYSFVKNSEIWKKQNTN